eukprot:scaffold146960_cov30-Tisochrysis_lutea.AAC.5
MCARRSLPAASLPAGAGAQKRMRPSAPPDTMPPSAAASAVTATPEWASRMTCRAAGLLG